MNLHSIMRTVASILLGIAYISCLLQWLWIAIVAVPPLVKTGAFDSFVQQTPPPKPVQQPVHQGTTPIGTLFVGIVTLLILIITVVVIIRLPKNIAKTGEKIVHQATDTVIPAVTHHKKLPEKKRKQLSGRIALLLQLVASLLPIGICLLLPSIGSLTTQIIVIVGIFFGIISLTSFTLAALIDLKFPTTRQIKKQMT